MRRYAVAVMLLLCLSWPAVAETDRAFNWASVALGAGVFADAWTTERALDSDRFVEMNIALPSRPTDSRFIAQVIVVDGAVYLAARKLRERHPKAAVWLLIGVGSLHAIAAAHNDCIYDR